MPNTPNSDISQDGPAQVEVSASGISGTRAGLLHLALNILGAIHLPLENNQVQNLQDLQGRTQTIEIKPILGEDH